MDHAIHRLYNCINRYALLVKNFLRKSFRPSGYENNDLLFFTAKISPYSDIFKIQAVHFEPF